MERGWLGFLFSAHHQKLKEVSGWDEAEVILYNGYLMSWWFYRVQTIRNIHELTEVQMDDFDRSIKGSYSRGLEKVWWEEWVKYRSPNDPTVAYCEKILASELPVRGA